MNLEKLLFTEITESQLLRDKLVRVIENEIEVATYDVPQDPEEFKKAVMDYMNLKEIELTQENYDCVADLMKKSGSQLRETITEKETVDTLAEYSFDEMKELIQLCILKQCEKIFQQLEGKEEEQYEYEVRSIMDMGGSTNTEVLTNLMNIYAKMGWRVKSVFTNELGHNSSSVGVGGVSTGVNSTVDEVVIVFERRVKK